MQDNGCELPDLAVRHGSGPADQLLNLPHAEAGSAIASRRALG